MEATSTNATQHRLDQLQIVPGETADGTMCWYILDTASGVQWTDAFETTAEARIWLGGYAAGLVDAASLAKEDSWLDDYVWELPDEYSQLGGR